MSDTQRELDAIRAMKHEIEDLEAALEHRKAWSSGKVDVANEASGATHHMRLRLIAQFRRWAGVLNTNHSELAESYLRAMTIDE